MGIETDTQDITGTIIKEKSYNHITQNKFEELITTKYSSSYLQTPPAYSAVRHSGKRLYEYAREGIFIKKEPKLVTLNSKILDWNPPYFEIEVSCSSGTYIRTVINDIANDLNSASTLVELRRTSQDPFTLDPIYSLSFSNLPSLISDQLTSSEIPPSKIWIDKIIESLDFYTNLFHSSVNKNKNNNK